MIVIDTCAHRIHWVHLATSALTKGLLAPGTGRQGETVFLLFTCHKLTKHSYTLHERLCQATPNQKVKCHGVGAGAHRKWYVLHNVIPYSTSSDWSKTYRCTRCHITFNLPRLLYLTCPWYEHQGSRAATPKFY